MIAEKTNLKDCWVIHPEVFEDERGYFYEGFNAKKFEQLTGVCFEVKQINQSHSLKGVLRGLHYQSGSKSQAKLISCIEGEVLDVAVDLREDSPTYGEHSIIRLSSSNKKLFYIPKGMAHGFLVLSDYAKLMYQVDEFYSKEHDRGIKYNDPDLNISWGVSEEQIILSEKDQKHPMLKKIKLSVNG